MLRFVSIAVAALALAAAAGCRGFDVAQTCIFADEDGNVVTVGYGSADKPHKNSYVNPFTGQEMEQAPQEHLRQPVHQAGDGVQV